MPNEPIVPSPAAEEPQKITVVIPAKTLQTVDERIKTLDSNVSRSQYFVLLAERDLRDRGPLLIFDKLAQPEKPMELSPLDYTVMLFAIAEMMDYEMDLEGRADIPKPPPNIRKLPVWQRLMKERNEILRYKWLESQKRGYDIGIEAAVRDFLQKCRQE